MKQFAALLILFFNWGAWADTNDTSKYRMPWVDRPPVTEAPISPQNHRTLDDFFLPSETPKLNWGEVAVDRFKQNSPQVATQNSSYEMHVFISKSIPDGALRQLFKQTKDFPPGSIRYVVRGFTPQEIGPLISHFRRLFPDPYTDDFIIEVDPGAFKQYRVDAVPVFLVKEEGKWFATRGMASLHGAIENVKRKGPAHMGEQYAIAEPDILEIIKERAKNFDWESAMKRAKGRLAKNLSPSFDLPTVLEPSEVLFEPTFVVPHDIEVPAHQGAPKQILATGGTKIKLLDHTRLQVPMIIIDASDDRQVRMLKKWRQGEFAHADVFIIGGYEEGQAMPASLHLANQIKKATYPWNARFSERFGVNAVPAIVDQVGNNLRVRYVKPQE